MNSPPLVPANVDLTDFPFMPLLIDRLKRSRAWLICKRRPELAFYMLNLWTASWHSRPAASLENDDDVLADLAMCSPDAWDRVKVDVLRGWVECDDGKLYHPVVAEQAMSSWAKKVAQRRRTGAAREAAIQAKAAKRSAALGVGMAPAGNGTGSREDHEKIPPEIAKAAGGSDPSPHRDSSGGSVTESVTEAATVSVTGSKGESRDRENPPMVPLSGDSAPRTQSRQPRRTARPAGELCPEDFRPESTHYAKAATWGRSAAWVDEQAESMKGWSRANANREPAWKSDWGRALHVWLRDQHGRPGPIMIPNGRDHRRELFDTNPTTRPTSGAPSMLAGMDAAEAALLRRPA